MLKNPLSKAVALILVMVIVYINFNNISPNILAWDVFGYYLYLPMTFIYKDITLEDIDIIHQIVEKYESTGTLYQIVTAPDGGKVMKYSMGLAILLAPFFFIGHLVALITEFPADGFSIPYQYSIWIGGMVYSAIGLFMLRKVLVQFFDDIITTVVLILIVLGTNYLYNVSYIGQNINPQNFGFTLYSIILWFTILWHRSNKIKHAILLSLFCGILILSRPTEIICLFIPLVWGITDKQSLKSKVRLLRLQGRQVIVFGLVVFLVGLPQLIYWKVTSGHILYYNYGGGGGEGMDFLTPHIFKVLFSFRKGWLIYTPVILFAFIGFADLYRVNKPILYAVLIYCIFNVYLVSCWSTWWYAACYGQRALIPSYPVLAIPLGYFILSLKSYKVYHKWPIYLILTALLCLNLFQTWQYSRGIISGTRMTRECYFRVFGKTHAYEADKKLLLVSRHEWPIEHVPDEGEYTKYRIHYNQFSNSSTLTGSIDNYLQLDTTKRFTEAYRIKYKDLTKNNHAYIRSTVHIYIPGDHQGELPLLVTSFENRRGLYKYCTRGINMDSIKYEAWNTITMDYLTPEIRSKNDELGVYVWYRGSEYVKVRDLEIDLFDPL